MPLVKEQTGAEEWGNRSDFHGDGVTDCLRDRCAAWLEIPGPEHPGLWASAVSLNLQSSVRKPSRSPALLN